MSIEQSFLGRGWAFPPAFSKPAGGRPGEVRMVSADEDIRQSLAILLSTAPGERVMRPEFGCGIKSHVFTDITYGTLAEMKDLIERAVLFFEPRINLDEIRISDRELHNGLLEIILLYTIRQTNTRSNMVYPFYIAEGTNVAP